MPSHIFDLYLLQSATHRAKDYAQDTINRVQRYLVNDIDKEQRTKEGFCQWCWYRYRFSLAGQALTMYTCWRCDKEHCHGNTAVPRLCRACADETKLCRSCCGTVSGEKPTEVP